MSFNYDIDSRCYKWLAPDLIEKANSNVRSVE